MSTLKTTTPRNIVFVHPDLGIGGAERLIIDAAVGLQSIGHKVTILTSYRDKAHCFEEARDGTLDVRVRGDSLFPAALGGSLSILFSLLRQLALVVSTGLLSTELRQLAPDVFIVDQLSACIPLFRLLYPDAKFLFYGHFPDKLLAKPETGLRKYVKQAYRVPFDFIEEWSTGCSDSIVVNSKFTRSVYKQTFPSTKSRELKVVYPCVDTEEQPSGTKEPLWPDKKLLLSINRFEGKKNLSLAVKAYAGLTAEERNRAQLVLAGGHDPRSGENMNCLQGLQNLSDSLSLTHATFRPAQTPLQEITAANVDVLFLLSIPHEVKRRLLDSASLLLYTPENEHFGIVPLEAMLAGVPPLATNTGGPLETIYDGRTGWLRSATQVSKWTDVMRKPLIPSSADTLRAMGARGRERVLAEFSQTKMTQELDREVQRLVQDTGLRPQVFAAWLIPVLVFTLIAAIAGGFVLRAWVQGGPSSIAGSRPLGQLAREAKAAASASLKVEL